jgi:hypothetical protein
VIPSAIYAALFFTVVVLVITAYFLMGGLPLLILKHDTPLDARFVRTFFSVYYRSAIWAGAGTAVSYALCGRPAFAIGGAAIALVAAALRGRLIPAMELIGSEIHTSGLAAIPRFRRIHVAALLINLVQLVAIVWGLTRISL